MELSQGEIIQKPKMQELSSLFMTHRINAMHALIKFPEYIPYGLGVMARTRSGTYGWTDGRTDGRTDRWTDRRTGRTGVILNALPLFSMHALVKFHEYIPYSLGVMARTPLTIWN